jgi:acyl-coenzyme A thioesterase PaaI-like protein
MNKTKQNTHLMVSEELVGSVMSIKKNSARIKLKTTREMAADQQSLVHGGFIFGMADYAAMLAVNEPTVVLGKAEVKFIKPVKVNDELMAEATITEKTDRKRVVSVIVSDNNNESVFEGTFVCFVPEKHVLEK